MEKRKGRPLKYDKHTVRISITCSPEQRKRIQDMAYFNRMSVSEFIVKKSLSVI